MRSYVMGYGSLLNRGSAARALKREISDEQILPIIIHGYRRAWLVKEQVFSEELQRTITALFLDVTVCQAGRINGVLIEVSPGEREMLAEREKNYDEHATLGTIEFPYGDPPRTPYQVFTFIGKSGSRVQAFDDDVFVMRRYVSVVESGCADLGADFLEIFRETTEAHERPILGGAYRCLDPAQADRV